MNSFQSSDAARDRRDMCPRCQARCEFREVDPVREISEVRCTGPCGSYLVTQTEYEDWIDSGQRLC